MTGTDLVTFCEEVNGGASIGSTLLYQLLNLSKAIVEQRRPWMVLRSTDTSKSVTVANTWQTAIDLSTIARFNRFYGDEPVRLFDGFFKIERYRQVPFDERLLYKDTPNTFVYDEANKTLYLNSTPTFAGTLWIHHIKDSADIAAATEWAFPSWSHPLLGFMAVAMNKGGIDYDDINRLMSVENRAQAMQIVGMLETWDANKQVAAQASHDPTDSADPGYRPGAINIHG